VILTSTYRQGLSALVLAPLWAAFMARLRRQRAVARLSSLLALALVWPLAASAATVAANGSATGGAILVVGQTNSYTFAATAGENLQVRLAKTSGTLVPRYELYGPSGNFITSSYASIVASAINAPASTTGTYTLVVSDFTNSGTTGNSGTGSYNLFVTRSALGAGAEAAVVPDGRATAGTVALGDLASYTFTATAGENLQVRVAKTSGTLVPRYELYGPSGNFITSSYASTVASAINAPASTTGAYTLVVSDFTNNGSTGNSGTGNYNLFVTRSALGTGAEGTVVPDGSATAGTMALGDLASYTFTATAGESLQVRVAKTSGTLLPRYDLYGPSGNFITSSYASTVASAISAPASTTGAYTLVVSDFTNSGTTGNSGTGSYNVYVARSAIGAASEASVLKAQSVAGQIDLGDLDTFKVAATAGQAFQITVSPTATGWVPRVDLYSATGGFVTSNYGSAGITVNATPTATGNYTAVVSDFTNSGSTGNSGTGSYTITATGAGDTGTAPSTGSDADTPLPFWVAWVFAGGLGMSVRRHLARKP